MTSVKPSKDPNEEVVNLSSEFSKLNLGTGQHKEDNVKYYQTPPLKLLKLWPSEHSFRQ